MTQVKEMLPLIPVVFNSDCTGCITRRMLSGMTSKQAVNITGQNLFLMLINKYEHLLLVGEVSVPSSDDVAIHLSVF